MNLETATNIKQSPKFTIIAIQPSTTSMWQSRIRQHITFLFQEERISYEVWADVERQNQFYVDISTHTAQEFSLDYENFSDEPAVVNPYFEVPFMEEESSSPMIESEELFVEQIKILVENGRISEARNMLATIAPGVSPRLDNWRNVLAKPTVKVGETATGGTPKDDFLWLQKHFSEYKGQWVALKQGILLGSNKSRLELHRSLQQAGKLAGAMFVRIDGDE